MKIGFIGLGIMGSRMAANLQKAGHSLILFNRTKEKAAELLANGATWAKHPADCARQCDILFTMLSTPQIVRQLAEGDEGFLMELETGKLWVDCSTVNPSFSLEMAAAAQAHGIHFLDAPVAGTKGPAEKGELLFLVGGDKKDVETAQPYFDIMGKKTLHLGEKGKGASMKILINLMLAQSVLAFSEAMSLGNAMQLDTKVLFDVLLATPVVAPVLGALRLKLEAEDRSANFPLKWMQKDIHLAASTAFEYSVPMPSLNTAKEVFAMAKQAGLGDEDFSSIYHFLNLK